MNACTKYGVRTAIFAGDLKHHYNPLDLRVIDFWRTFIGLLRSRDITPVVVLGNHDRIGLYQDDHNWLPILRDAGAEVYWEPGVMYRTGTGSIYILPFIRDKVRFQEASDWLGSQKTNVAKDILVFHHTLTGAWFNRIGAAIVKPEEGIPIDSIHPEKFRYCIGGDIHLPQWVTNTVVYTGSPFPQDWGEVNQGKFFVLVAEKGLEWISSKMPGWYDPNLKGFKEPDSWTDTVVRIRVAVAKGEDYGAKLELARNEALTNYPGAEIVTTTDVEDVLNDAGEAPKNLSEQEQIVEYIQKSLPEPLRDRVDEMNSYVLHKLRATGLGLRSHTGIRFVRAWAEKFLCFDKLELDFTKPGLILVVGENRNWPGRSNGSGKSSALCVILVALFGKNLKGQSFDSWVQRDSEGTSKVGVEFNTADGSLVRVERTRRPASIRIFVNGTEVSAGNMPATVNKDIETLCGYSWDTFTSSTYVTREEVALLWGKPLQKQEIISKLQNLERFGAAFKIVHKDLNHTNAQRQEYVFELDAIQRYLTTRGNPTDITYGLKTARTQLKKVTADIAKVRVPDTAELRKVMDEGLKRVQKLRDSSNQFRTDVQYHQGKIDELARLPTVCSVCGQKIPRDKKRIQAQIVQLETELKPVRVRMENANNARVRAQKAYDDAFNKYDEVRHAATRAGEMLRQLKLQETDLVREVQTWEARNREFDEETSRIEQSVKYLTALVEWIDDDVAFITAAEALLSRDGLPAYISQLLCPRLTQAAKYYSNLFTDGEIQVRFAMVNGEVEIELVNRLGGENLEAQSDGEGGLATLITSFASRDVGLKSNILVLDEPGDGLDSANARAFAAGLRNIKGDFGQVFLITHNADIISELGDVRVMKVVKEDGVSSII